MLEKLGTAQARYDEISAKLSDPKVVSDNKLYTGLMREYKNLTPLIDVYKLYLKANSDYEDAKAALEDGDEELREMAQEELLSAKERMEQYTEELKILLLPRDPDDDKSVIVEIRAGAGGEEAALFANSMFRMYSMYAARQGWKIDVMSSNPTELGGYREISFGVEGESVYAKLKYESGVHRVQRVPETEAQGRIQTSTATVAVLPEVEDVDFELNMDELEITRHRSAGAGGQHVNKTESAIRIIHIPTGMTVDCQDERSQIKNKEKALKIMKSRLADLYNSQKEQAVASERRAQVGTGDRSERIRTYNYPQGRITDHRIGYTVYSLESFLNGRMDDMIDALISADRAEKLKAGLE